MIGSMKVNGETIGVHFVGYGVSGLGGLGLGDEGFLSYN